MELLDTRSNLASYPKSALKNLEKISCDFIRKAIKHHDYDGLKHALNSFGQFAIDYLVVDAIQYLDVNAVNIADAYIKEHSSAYQVTDQNLHEIFDNDSNPRFFSDNKDELNAKRISILKMVVSWLKPEQITASNLNFIAQKLPKSEFDDFCASKALDLNKFPDLDLSSYKYDNATSIVTLDDNKASSVVEVLLSRTYGDTLVASKMYAMYHELYNLDPIAREMLTYMATLIKNGNDVKVIIEPKATSSYSPGSNVIKVDPDLASANEFTTSSVLIHEIGHFFYHQLFKVDAMPFYANDIKSMIKKFSEDDFIDLHMQIDLSIKDDPSFVSLINMLKKYEEAAKKPLNKAAELLQVTNAVPEKYGFTSEYVEYFKQSTFIDVFYLNASYGSKNEGYLTKETPIHIYKSILDIYMQYSGPGYDSCPAIGEDKEFAQGEIETWAVEEFLPYIVETLKLDAKDIHFLQRIADYVNRGKHMYEENRSSSDNNKYAELIVRYLELKAADAKPDVVESFEGLAQYHRDFVSPYAQQVISEYQDNCHPFNETNVVGEQHNICFAELPQ